MRPGASLAACAGACTASDVSSTWSLEDLGCGFLELRRTVLLLEDAKGASVPVALLGVALRLGMVTSAIETLISGVKGEAAAHRMSRCQRYRIQRYGGSMLYATDANKASSAGFPGGCLIPWRIRRIVVGACNHHRIVECNCGPCHHDAIACFVQYERRPRESRGV